MKKFLRIAIGFVVVVVGIVAVVWFLTGDATKVAEQQVTAIKNNDIAEAYDLCSTEFKEATSLEVFTAYVTSYEVLTKNSKISFNDRAIENNITMLNGTLTAESGAEAEVEYRLIKEDGAWKVLGLEVKGAGVSGDVDSTAAASVAAAKTFDESGYGYTLEYPASWVFEESGTSTVVFSGAEGTDAFDTTVNIQNVTGATVTSLIADLKEQLGAPELDGKISGEKTYTHTMADGQKLVGKEFTVTYTYNGTDIKQRQIVIPGGVEDFLHALAYTAPVEKYNGGLAVAEEILGSFAVLGN